MIKDLLSAPGYRSCPFATVDYRSLVHLECTEDWNMTEGDLAKYYSQYGAAQGIDRMGPGLPRKIRRMKATGTASQQVTLGTNARLRCRRSS